MLVTIQEMLPMVARDFDNKTKGTKDTFYSKGFVLSDGLNTFYAEAIGNLAQRLEREPLNTSAFINVEVSMNARSYEDSKNQKRYSTDIIIQRIGNI